MALVEMEGTSPGPLQEAVLLPAVREAALGSGEIRGTFFVLCMAHWKKRYHRLPDDALIET
jgi:hypothetical protein